MRKLTNKPISFKKYSQKVSEYESEIRTLKYELGESEKEVADLDKKLSGYEAWTAKVEGRESYVAQENKWLRETLRLVVVPRGKEVELAKAIRQEQKEMGI